MNIVSIDYSFSSLARFLSDPRTTLPQLMAASLKFNLAESSNDYHLVPINLSIEKRLFDDLELESIEFNIVDGRMKKYGRSIVISLTDKFFFVFHQLEKHELEASLIAKSTLTILDFLNCEFGVESCFLIGEKFDIENHLLGEKFKNVQRLSSEGTQIHTFMPSVRRIDSELNEIPDLILTAGPSVSMLESIYVQDAVTSGWNLHHSDYLNAFEEKFADFVGAKFAMATSSCSGALHLSLLALGIGPGDEVLVPDITWVATASAVMYVGARPIFVDIDQATWTISVEKIESLITSKTKAIIPVHLYGYAAPMLEIIEIAEAYGLFVVEDAAPAIGTKITNKSAGSFGDFGCYSFQGAKLLVTGEGGMLVSNNEELFAHAKKIQDHGRRPGTFWIEELGYKYKMNNITAALGLAQIQRSENQIFRKRRINQWYREGLVDVPNISFQEEAMNTESICWMTSFVLTPNSRVSRDELIKQLRHRGIDSRPVFPSISQYPIWKYETSIPEISKFVGDNGINLPSGVLLNKQSVDKVIREIRNILT